MDISLEKSNSVSCSSFASFVEKETFSSKGKTVFNVRRSNFVEDVLAKCELLFREDITPTYVKFLEDPKTEKKIKMCFGMMPTSWITVIPKT